MNKESPSSHAERELLKATNMVVNAARNVSDNSLQSNHGFYVSKEDMEKLRKSVGVWSELLSIYYNLCGEEWDEDSKENVV